MQSTKILTMVQELQHQSVPEEFFNLTQLAEVTFIAGKLSTTDINEIKNYISKSEDNNVKYHEMNQEKANKILAYHNDKQNYESTKKKWKNNWENFMDHNIHYKQMENKNYNTVQVITDSPLLSTASKTYTFLSSSCSSVSSDDDSTKSLLSYSHKVFDRKKQRTFKQSSTESEFDFHYESPQISYNANGTDANDTICDNTNSNQAKSDDDMKHENDTKDNVTHEFCHESQSSDHYESNAEGRIEDHICPECGKKYSTSKFRSWRIDY